MVRICLPLCTGLFGSWAAPSEALGALILARDSAFP